VPYIRSLDGLRAIAILLVMSVHYHQKFGGGWIGVQLFFVISGFLITRILLDAKADSGFGEYLGRFYARRTLRIFPLYYGFVVVLACMSIFLDLPSNWTQVRPWLLTYTLNFGHMFHLVPVDDLYSHFWSLAVEEQFYLVWPFVVWSLSRKSLRYVVLAILLLAPVLRAVMVAHGAEPEQLYFFTPGQMDAFAAGAALTVFDVRTTRPLPLLLCAGAVTIALGVLANWQFNPGYAITTAGYPYFMPHHLQYAWGYTLLNLCGALAILTCLQGGLRWLEWRVLVHIGQISYGIYVFHRPVVGLLDRYASRLPLSGAAQQAAAVVLYVVISYALAWLSYRYFESRFLRLKNRWFPPTKDQPAAVPGN
jgi:peptidoglycan/LPS O-acetylase OafA/YrhL